MKILHVINSLHIGGAEKLIVDLVPLLKQQGLEVDLLLLNGVNTAFKSALEKQSVTIYSLGEKNNIYNPLLIFRIRKYIRNYDLVHVHLFPSQYWVAIANILALPNVKFVTTEHNTTNRRRNISIFKWIDRFLYKRYKIVISISNKANELLGAYLQKSIGLTTILNGIHVSDYRNAEKYGKNDFLKIRENDLFLTMVGGFRGQKDQDTLIRALLYLPSHYHLALVGDGTRKVICEQLVNELKLHDRVHFLGLRDDVPRILKTSDIIVMSSHYEGLSLSSIEGMASGKPFFASNVNGLREITEGAGVLFEKGNEKDLAIKILDLVSHPDKYKEVAQKCQERAAEYDIQKMVKSYIHVYNEVMELS